jgi:hypothetical protein
MNYGGVIIPPRYNTLSEPYPNLLQALIPGV